MAVHGRGDKKRWEGKKKMIKRRVFLFFIFYFLWRYYRKKIALNKGKKKKRAYHIKVVNHAMVIIFLPPNSQIF